jgi:hypothetical protein
MSGVALGESVEVAVAAPCGGMSGVLVGKPAALWQAARSGTVAIRAKKETYLRL